MKIIKGSIGILKSIFGIDCIASQYQAERMVICSMCQFFRNKKCFLCGCYLVHKTRLKSEKCPAGKW